MNVSGNLPSFSLYDSDADYSDWTNCARCLPRLLHLNAFLENWESLIVDA